MRQIEPNTFICADNAEVLRDLPDGFCDLCLTDPPYGINIAARNGSIGQRKGQGVITRYEYSTWDSVKPGRESFEEMRRVSKQQIVWGGNYFTDCLPPSQCWLVWNKKQPEGVSFAMAELAYTSFSSSVKWFECSRALIGNKVANNPEKAKVFVKYHPTQKPVPLFVWCLLNYSKPGDLIIDPFCGSGTTALACHKTGRRFICIDREPKYIEIAQQRYQNLVAQTELFGAGEIESGATSANSAGTQNAQVAMELES